jgi:hypothetical protein
LFERALRGLNKFDKLHYSSIIAFNPAQIAFHVSDRNPILLSSASLHDSCQKVAVVRALMCFLWQKAARAPKAPETN